MKDVFLIFLIFFIAFIWFDVGVFVGTPQSIRDEWLWQKFIPGGAIYFTIYPPNQSLHTIAKGVNHKNRP